MTSFSLKTGQWDIAWPDRIKHYDLVCLAPPLDPIQGLPLGNGDLGALVWCEPQFIQIAVNKCDLWQDTAPEITPEEMHKNAPLHTEDFTSLRHACRVTIDLGMPLLDTWYLKDFEARLDLARGMVLIRSVTPFGKLQAEILISRKDRVLSVALQIEAQEPVAPRIEMTRWGSRLFHMWYSQRDRDVTRGLSGTRAEVAGRRLMIHQALRNMSFTVAAEAMDQARDVAPVPCHSRSGRFETTGATHHAIEFNLAVANSEEVADPRAEALRLLTHARHKGRSAVVQDHEDEWKNFWAGTHVRFGDPCIEQMWHLTIYYAGSSQRGRYPGLFTQALWGWNRDFQPWNFYFHWNQQQLIWPLAAANHPELVKPYLDYRYVTLESARRNARLKGRPGAHYCDVADRKGMSHPDNNRTPGAQIAQLFWDYYRYNGDRQYLFTRGWPVIAEVARFHLAILEKKDDGLYHTTPGWGYEGGNMLKDCVTELIATRRVFEIALATAALMTDQPPFAPEVGADELAQWRDALDHLAPLVTMESPLNPGVTIFAAGYQKGIEKNQDQHFCGGFKEGDAEEWDNPKPTCAHDPKRWGQIFSDVETSPVFPDGRIGLGQKGTREFDIALATARESSQHWTHAIVLARLGMRESLPNALADIRGESTKYHWTPTGFSHDGVDYWGTPLIADPAKAPHDYLTKDSNGPEWEEFRKSRLPMRKWEFRRIGQELPYLLTTSINESLMQSHDGVIRVAPAVPLDWGFAFTLLAVGGFLVSAQGKGEQVDWIHILSQRGGECRVANPWSGPVFVLDVEADMAREISGREVAFATLPGRRYLISSRPLKVADWVCQPENAKPNSGPRNYGEQLVLGIPKMY